MSQGIGNGNLYNIQSIKIHPHDNVAVAIQDLAKGSQILVDGEEIELLETVKSGHKIALCSMHVGDKVIKYNNPIGTVITPILKGQWIHTHNIKTTLEGILEYHYTPDFENILPVAGKFFWGFERNIRKPASETLGKKIGIRNDIWVIPTVGCVNHVATTLAKRTNTQTKGSVGKVIAFPHPYGCSQLGEDGENTLKILTDLILHPNTGGVLLIGLGCENTPVKEIQKALKEAKEGYDPDRVRFLICQEVEDELEVGESLIQELIQQAQADVRTQIEAKYLAVGLKCGGSDGFSGITANPVVGAFSDQLVSMGGTTILTEVPEMFGAETLLMNRCKNKAVFQKTVEMINDFKAYFIACDQPIYENPSPGNKEGGISTLEDKSLGCTQKSGTAPVTDVLKYGDRLQQRGLSLLSAPGNDLVAATALAAAGAHIVLFTTGRGTPFACPVPTIKISSNTALAQKKANWIDFNAGVVLEGEAIHTTAEKLLDLILAVASGQFVKSEVADFYDMAIFKKGVTL